jgi:hypothetical protein
MTDPGPQIVSPPTNGGLWDAASRLAEEFALVAPREIAAVLIEARRGVGMLGLDGTDGMARAEKIARERLIQLTATAETQKHSPRLDPERHDRRRKQ